MFDDDYKFALSALAIVSILVIMCVAINVGTQHSYKVDAIAAGMKAQEVQEACK